MPTRAGGDRRDRRRDPRRRVARSPACLTGPASQLASNPQAIEEKNGRGRRPRPRVTPGRRERPNRRPRLFTRPPPAITRQPAASTGTELIERNRPWHLRSRNSATSSPADHRAGGRAEGLPQGKVQDRAGRRRRDDGGRRRPAAAAAAAGRRGDRVQRRSSKPGSTRPRRSTSSRSSAKSPAWAWPKPRRPSKGPEADQGKRGQEDGRRRQEEAGRSRREGLASSRPADRICARNRHSRYAEFRKNRPGRIDVVGTPGYYDFYAIPITAGVARTDPAAPQGRRRWPSSRVPPGASSRAAIATPLPPW